MGGWCCSKMCRNLAVTRMVSSANIESKQEPLSVDLTLSMMLTPTCSALQSMLIDRWFHRRLNIKQVDSDK